MKNKPEQKSKIDEMQGVIEEHRALQTQYQELEAKYKKLNDELTKAKKDIEMFEPYREFVTEVVPKVWIIELTNKYAIDNLRRLERTIYGGQIEVLAKEQEELAKPRVARMNKIVEKAIWYITRNSFAMSTFIKTAIREPGDDI